MREETGAEREQKSTSLKRADFTSFRQKNGFLLLSYSRCVEK